MADQGSDEKLSDPRVAAKLQQFYAQHAAAKPNESVGFMMARNEIVRTHKNKPPRIRRIVLSSKSTPKEIMQAAKQEGYHYDDTDSWRTAVRKVGLRMGILLKDSDDLMVRIFEIRDRLIDARRGK